MWEPQQERRQKLHRNRGTVFSVWFVTKYRGKFSEESESGVELFGW
jgi:hypothetical protein